MPSLKIRRALISVSDKNGIEELARALAATGAEIVATGRTAAVIKDAGVAVTPIEKISGCPEAFQGRMKTLSFPVCGGILYRRGDASDEADLKKLGIAPIDCVVVNFYPFEKAAATSGISTAELPTLPKLIEEIDIGGPTLVRAAAKNSPDVLTVTDPAQYGAVVAELKAHGAVSAELARRCTARAWGRVAEYDAAIQAVFGESASDAPRLKLRYGENPHQSGSLEVRADGPIAWPVSPQEALTPSELSYNNILDLSAAYALASDLAAIAPDAPDASDASGASDRLKGVVIVKHNNPCGVALAGTQMQALLKAWEGDPVSAFGGVVVFTDPIEEECAGWLAARFIELVAAPGLAKGGAALTQLLAKRRNLKAVAIRRFGEVPAEVSVIVPGGILRQSADRGLSEDLKSVTRVPWPRSRNALATFGIAVCRTLKSNAVALVRELPAGSAAHSGAKSVGGFQLVGAGQGQPNRVEALEALAVPRARRVLEASGGEIGDCVLVSDAFFPFRDTVDKAHAAGVRAIIQPGGSIKDAESIAACDEHGIAMAFTGIRHFRH